MFPLDIIRFLITSDRIMKYLKWGIQIKIFQEAYETNRVQRGSSPRLEGRGLSSPSIDLDYRGSLGEGRGLIFPKNTSFYTVFYISILL